MIRTTKQRCRSQARAAEFVPAVDVHAPGALYMLAGLIVAQGDSSLRVTVLTNHGTRFGPADDFTTMATFPYTGRIVCHKPVKSNRLRQNKCKSSESEMLRCSWRPRLTPDAVAGVGHRVPDSGGGQSAKLRQIRPEVRQLLKLAKTCVAILSLPARTGTPVGWARGSSIIPRSTQSASSPVILRNDR